MFSEDGLDLVFTVHNFSSMEQIMTLESLDLLQLNYQDNMIVWLKWKCNKEGEMKIHNLITLCDFSNKVPLGFPRGKN